jgi:hypothetical protein
MKQNNMYNSILKSEEFFAASATNGNGLQNQ